MGRVQLTIRCKQVIHYDQQVLVTPEEAKILKSLEYDEVSERRNSEAYSILEGYINPMEILDCDREYTDVEIE